MRLGIKRGSFITVVGFLPLLLIVGLISWQAAGVRHKARANGHLVSAIIRDDATAVRQALGDGADMKAMIKVWNLTPLQLASATGREAAIVALLNAGADINRPDEHGFTPLMRAITNGRLSTVKLLLSRGADVKAKNSLGGTALELAATSPEMTQAQRATTVALLQQAKALK